MMVFVDTSALIALLDRDDARHAEAAAIFTSLETNAELVTSNYVEIETLAVVRRRLGTDDAARLIDAIYPLIRTIWVDQATHAAALAEYRLSGGSASVVDRVSFIIMRREGVTQAFAFDADFAAQGFELPTVAAGPHRVQEPVAPYGNDAAADLVSVTEISARAGRPINTIQSWRRRHPDFPAPVAQLAAGPVWIWPSIAEWIASRPVRRVAGHA